MSDGSDGQGFGNERPPAHRAGALRAKARYLVLIDSGGSALALLFTEARGAAAEFDGGSEEVAQMTRGLQAQPGASGPEWDLALAGHGAHERAVAQVFTLDV